MYPPLTFPSFDCKITEINGKAHIYCLLRRKNLVLTPEEWVRQHLIHFLVNTYDYPLSLMRIEGGLRYNRLAKRTDLIVFDRNGKPFLLAECKAPTVLINKAVMEQTLRYNQVINAPYLLLSNGSSAFLLPAIGNWL